MSPRTYVALGSNLGDRAAHLAHARRRLATLEGTRLLGASVIEETPPLENRKQPFYLNQMVALETSLAPRVLLAACRDVERESGRERREPWGSRTLDLDLVSYEGVTLGTPELTLPHPGLGRRPFWQRELAELGRLGL